MSDNSKSLDTAEKKLRDLGLPLPGKPIDSEVAWPDNVADLAPVELAHHLTWWAGWGAFTRYHLAKSETNLASFEAEYDLLVKETMFKSTGDYKTVTELKASIAQMPSVVKIQGKTLEATAMVKMLRAVLEGYQAKYATVSREISRRGLEFDENTDKGDSYRVGKF